MNAREVVANLGLEELMLLEAAISERRADLSLAHFSSAKAGQFRLPMGGREVEVVAFGDIGNPSYNDGYKYLAPRRFRNLDHALHWLEIWGLREKFDPEDDRVVIYEWLPSGHRKPVWHASGWHWSGDEVDGVKLLQGRLRGYEVSVYDEAAEDA